MIVALLYQLTRRLLPFPATLLHRDITKDAELLVLRHENSVLRRTITSQVRVRARGPLLVRSGARETD